MICFEDTVPWIARGFASMPNKPIDFLVNQSNDGWFPHSMEAHYHAVAGLFRCVENRLAMVRATNFGVTCLIDSCGRIRDRHPIGEPGGLTVSVPVDRRQSLYTRWGDWLPISCWLVIGFGGFRFLVTAWQRTRRRLETKVSSGSWPTE
jgi:apolipoprotein N-acyltransferase